MLKILILNGPNLNKLGIRDPKQYGSLTLEEINKKLIDLGKELNTEVICMQSNHEGALIDILQESSTWADGIIINPGGYSHTSISLRDAISDLNLKVIEVHLSNIYAREEFRHHSLISPVCVGSIAGLGWRSYTSALSALVGLLNEE